MAENKVNAVVRLANRQPTEADQLLARIEEIQSTCRHDYRYLTDVELRPSLVGGVLIGEGLHSLGRTVRCLHCSLEKKVLLHQLCPNCLETMTRMVASEDMLTYFGRRDGSAVARRYVCRCGLRLVNAEAMEH